MLEITLLYATKRYVVMYDVSTLEDGGKQVAERVESTNSDGRAPAVCRSEALPACKKRYTPGERGSPRTANGIDSDGHASGFASCCSEDVRNDTEFGTTPDEVLLPRRT